jgi:hypothetical protein
MDPHEDKTELGVELRGEGDDRKYRKQEAGSREQ